MLVIPRERNEAIILGDGIEVTVVEIQDDEVRLAIKFPAGTTVRRGEVAEAALQEANPAE